MAAFPRTTLASLLHPPIYYTHLSRGLENGHFPTNDTCSWDDQRVFVWGQGCPNAWVPLEVCDMYQFFSGMFVNDMFQVSEMFVSTMCDSLSAMLVNDV